MTSPAKSTPYSIYVTSRPSPTLRASKDKSAQSCADVFARITDVTRTRLRNCLKAHVARSSNEKILSPPRIPLNLSILPRKEGQTCHASYSRTLVDDCQKLRVSSFSFSVYLFLLSQRNPWNRVTFVRNQAVVSTQGPNSCETGFALSFSLSLLRAPLPSSRQIEFIVTH